MTYQHDDTISEPASSAARAVQGEPVPTGTDFSSIIESDVPIVVQHTRLDSRQAELALVSTIAFAGD